MTFREKGTWITLVLAFGAYVLYSALIFGRRGNTSLAEVSYAATLIWTMAALIVANVVVRVAVAMASPEDAEKNDQRDRQIGRFGRYTGHWVLVAGILSAMGMSMAEVDHFWIANALFLSIVLATVLRSAVKLIAYRRGLPSSW